MAPMRRGSWGKATGGGVAGVYRRDARQRRSPVATRSGVRAATRRRLDYRIRRRARMAQDISYSVLVDAIRHRPGTFDVPCPTCGPNRRSLANRRRKVLRVWHAAPGFITYSCARCGVRGCRPDHRGRRRNRNGLSIRGCRDWWRGVMRDVRHSCLVPDRGLVLPAPDGFVAAGRVGCGAPQADGHLKKWVRGCGSRRPSTSMSILSL